MQKIASRAGRVGAVRAVEPYRQELEAEARATVRFETPPGKQMQIDFGERLVAIGGAKVKAYLFVATLGYSRRLHVRAFRNERQAGLASRPNYFLRSLRSAAFCSRSKETRASSNAALRSPRLLIALSTLASR